MNKIKIVMKPKEGCLMCKFFVWLFGVLPFVDLTIKKGENK